MFPIKATQRKGRPRVSRPFDSRSLDFTSIARADKISDCKVLDPKQLKILTPKQRLPVALAYVKACNTSEITQIMDSLHQATEVTKKYTTI